MFNDALMVGSPNFNDRRLKPGLLTVEEAKKMPPTTFGITGYDPLRDEGLLYAKFLTEQGAPTNVHVFRALPHAFRMLGDKLSASSGWD
ncbi:hypothetical protein TSTA_098480 [Talaromyces stipitatus ATCC 10500]|uniref:Alpha/beta hydrolase fold-3 domain-containing protein n=1 Tax=Talaromyces stipitatus (strain ATCC 10500 / CBS 375.48 / QM 6759 / NRRL 1006) TaxID=441959 RepID=B8MM79_TALSN|nr:uncharacterized protein TSTA_098480 [Talaromyces stipitatus ATCC 10500]EED13591.1 hypothetical protein TSTA_098480 [Talaromyces stipitatus ATCC 10500]